ncbi:vapd [Helicobacter sp. MIT 11-5569]|jgi:virulence-associated protein VapD|uniref:VapD family protein n=1 Tax=Helicobacter TaxID=209 RepID=UPI00047DC0A6|nr:MULTISPECIES: VapD family protein [Helicobacter]TLD80753.1 vapd [Helicobacter sp. MIT 11-5569]
MSLTRKAINFDLYTDELKKSFLDTREPYNQIKRFMLENGFEHRQYSGYVSKEPMSDRRILKMVRKLSKELAWISECVKEFDVTEIGEQYSLKETIQNMHSKAKIKEVELNQSNKFKAKFQEFKEQSTKNQKFKDLER